MTGNAVEYNWRNNVFPGKPKRGLAANRGCELTTPNTFTRIYRVRPPDPPERVPDEVTQFDHLFKTGNSYHLARHLGSPATTLVEADRWIVPGQSFNKARAHIPDRLVAFDMDPEIYAAISGYVVSEQGKTPDFATEGAPPSTAATDLNRKRDFYAAIGMLEYWLFDRTGEYRGTQLAGFRLVDDDRYQAMAMDAGTADVMQGYSAALGLYLR